MKPPIDLYRPTLLNIISIICYCVATIFHIIAYATDNWASLLLDGVRWRMGLWQGCREMEDNTEFCTPDVFEDKAFQTGSDWHLGARVMMTLALILIFLLEFTLIGYACIKNLEKYRSKLVGTTLALSLSTAFCHFLVLIMYGTEVDKIPESEVKGSYGIVVISFLIELVIPILVYIDKSRRFPASMRFIIPKRFSGNPRQTNNSGNSRIDGGKKDRRIPYTIEGASVSMFTSVPSLSEMETFKKFASTDDFDPSTASLGSMNSINTRSTMYTNVSFTDRTSLESGV